ncbi:MAG TPA: hypothetical protein VK689_19410 [Armatimonadota bacterium]|nr:hypothetical protein [Armatimonadota bacterium]
MLNHTRWRPGAVALAGVLVALFLGTAAGAGRYSVVVLEELQPAAISNTGYVAGNVVSDVTPVKAVVRRPDGALTEIVGQGVPGRDAELAVATGVNDAGDVVGHYRPRPWDGISLHPFVFRGGVFHDLSGQLGTSTHANGINNAGAIVGMRRVFGQERAYVLRPDGVLIDLGPGNARAVSDTGYVVGNTEERDTSRLPFVFREANGNGVSDPGELIRLGTLGQRSNAARGVNDAGQVVGCVEDAIPANHAVIWSAPAPGAPPVELAARALPNACANAINNRGQIVGFYQDGAFLFENGRAKDLKTLIRAAGGGGPEVEPRNAIAINQGGSLVATAGPTPQARMGVLLLAPVTPALDALTVSPNAARAGSRVTVAVRLTIRPPRPLAIPVTVTRDGQPQRLRLTVQVRGTSGAKRVWLPRRLEAGTYTLSATLGGATRTATLTVSP